MPDLSLGAGRPSLHLELALGSYTLLACAGKLTLTLTLTLTLPFPHPYPLPLIEREPEPEP